MSRLGVLLWYKGEKNQGITLLRAASKKNVAAAKFVLGLLYLSGQPGLLKRDRDGGLDLIREARAAGNQDAVDFLFKFENGVALGERK